MAYRAPLRLLRDGRPVGTVVSYGYETPWATGRLAADDPGEQARGDAICAFLAWLDAQPDLSDEEYARACAWRGLTEAEIDDWYRAEWALVDEAGTHHPAYALAFLGDGFVTWRW
jgi:hypothetical protein